MKTTKRITIHLLGAGLLLGATAARAEEKMTDEEKAAAGAYNIERVSELPWTELRQSFGTYLAWEGITPLPKDNNELQERFAPPYGELKGGWIKPVRRELQERQDRMYEDLTKRQGEVYKQIDEGKVVEAYPTVFDLWVLEQWLTDFARGGQSGPYFAARAEVLLDQAGKERRAAQGQRAGEAMNKSIEEARQEYEAALKVGIEANPKLAAAERRLKAGKAKLEALGVNEKGESKGGAPKSPGETADEVSPLDKTTVEDAAKEYREAEGAVKGFKDAFDRDPENGRLKHRVEDKGGHGFLSEVLNPDHNGIAHGGTFRRERWECKLKLGWFGPDWQVPGAAPDPALPRVDESGKKAGTAKAMDLGPSTGSTGSGQAGSGQGNPSTGSTGSPQASSGQGVKLELVWIPAGEFMMGSPTNEAGRYMDERLHRVKLTKGFWMGKYEVTQEQWQRVMGNNPSWFTNAGPKAPVETVRYDQAQKFMRKLNEMTAGQAGGKFRFPTEAEWEWACRAGTATALYGGKMTIKGGNNSPEVGAIAWYAGNSGVEYEGGVLSTLWEDKEKEHHSAGTHPVGQKPPNDWGLYDMLGNVAEWCEDWYYAYPSQAVTDPTGPKGSVGDGSPGNHVLRGGSWFSGIRLCRSAARSYSFDDNVWRTAAGGFRVAMDEPAAGQAAEKAK